MPPDRTTTPPDHGVEAERPPINKPQHCRETGRATIPRACEAAPDGRRRFLFGFFCLADRGRRALAGDLGAVARARLIRALRRRPLCTSPNQLLSRE
jgi:hypothetical protein